MHPKTGESKTKAQNSDVKIQMANKDDEEISRKEVLEVVKKLGLKKFRDVTSLKTSISKNNSEKSVENSSSKTIALQNSARKKNSLKKNLKHKNDGQYNKGDENITASQKIKAFKAAKNNKKINSDTDNTSGTETQRLIIKPNGKWFNLVEDINFEDVKPISTGEAEGLKKEALKLLENDAQIFKSICMQGEQRSDFLWTEKIIKSGTLPDRMAGYSIKIQDSPVHNLLCIQQLISMAKVQGKQQCLVTAETIKDLFLEDLLPPDRKLISFESRGSVLKVATKKQLIVWMFEDRLKFMYQQYIESIRRMASDTVDKLRGKAISIIQQLLVAHPELENVLLEMLVNKLGDPIKKVGSRALFHLTKLVERHPRMKMVVIQEVERLLFRNNISVKAQYYGICFLNSIRLENEHPQVSSKLILVYLAFFKGCIKTGDIDSKMMSGLLTGVNKAYPTAKQHGFQFRESMDTLFKIVQLSQFNICVHALCILHQLIDVNKDQAAADRFYRVLYRTLLNSEFVTTAHNMQFLNLVYKSMKKDTIRNRVIAFTKRLLQICQNVQPNLACAILVLISEISKIHEGNLVLGEVAIIESNLPVTSDQDSFTDNETDLKTLKTAEKRKKRLDMANLVKSTNIQICDVSDNLPGSDVKATETENTSSSIKSRKTDLDGPIALKNEKDEKIRTTYDPTARNPTFSGAEHCVAFELISLTNHYHPTVSLYAHTLVKREKISYDGNPLKDFTISRFLDRFVYRNAKVKKNRAEYQPKGLRNVAVNSTKYLQVEEDKVPEEEKFFYKYFKNKKQLKKDTPEDEDSEVESIDDEEFDEFMGNYFKTGSKMDDSEDENDVDFAAEVGASKKKRLKKGDIDSESDSDGELQENEYSDSDDNDDFTELGDEDDDDGVMESDIDMDELDPQFGSNNRESEDDIDALEATHLKDPRRKVNRRKNHDQDMFAPADQFADLLEENTEDILSGAQTLINAEKADKKQIQWEMERDRKIKGFKRSNRRHMAKFPNKKRKFK